MRFPRSLVSIAMTGLLVVACGGTATPTKGPDGVTPTQNPGGGGGGTPTQAPQATQAGGGGVLPGNGSGKVNYEISGPVQKSGEVPFFGIGSRFSGPAGVSYTFSEIEGGSEIIGIFPDVSNPDAWLVSYLSDEFQVSATSCTMTNLVKTDTSASGSFDCAAIITNSSGMYDTNGHIKGTFEARA